jgi:hypothetical protein
MRRLNSSSSLTSDPPAGTPPGMFRQPEVPTEAEVIEAAMELKALRRHALEVVDPEAES